MTKLTSQKYIGLAKKYIFLIIFLLIILLSKIPHLNDAYYWDECWPYASAIDNMYQNGVSLLPGSIPAELSRGHPLFFHAAAATWLNIFGQSHVSNHSFALFISILFIAFIYYSCIQLFNRRVAILSVLVIGLQVAFYVQSSLLLLEVLVVFMILASFYFYINEQYFATGLSLCILFFTKESGLIAGFVIGIDALLKLIDTNYPVKKKFSAVLAVGIPTLLVAAFFIAQKRMYGWYIFPVHSDFLKHEWGAFLNAYWLDCINDSFVKDYKDWIFLLLVILGIVFGLLKKKYFVGFPVLLLIIIYFLSDKERSNSIPHHTIIFLLFQIIWVAQFYLARKLLPEARQQKWLILISWFILLFLSFSAVNFLTYRYLMAAFIPLLIIFSVFAEKYSASIHPKAFYIITIITISIGIYSFSTNTSTGDTGLNMYDGLAVQQDVVDFLEAQNAYDKNIAAQSYLQRIHLTDPATGFLQSFRKFNHVEWEINSHTDYIIFDNLDLDTRYQQITLDPHFKKIHFFQKGTLWVEVYKKKNTI